MHTMPIAKVLERTRAYIRENFLYMRPDFPLGDDDPLLAKGIIDSMGVTELVVFLEQEFDLVVAAEDITEQNFGTVASIARYVAASLSNGGHP